ncbi:MAG: phosphoribosylanthranilate isomerase [Ruminococcus sp.]|jgi:phosphoribosylanthranilate isomerase|nr:phosphoribosylanthranilate isomerase [Ruminococcus sp.]
MKHLKLKICGIKNDTDVNAVNLTQPDYAGFVFAPSRRKVDFETAKILREQIDKKIVTVGVFVNAPVDEIALLVESGIISVVQLHGEENFDFLSRLKKITGVPIIQAIKENTAAVIHRNSDFLLFDSKNPGSGEIFDRSTINPAGKPWFLAGGLTPENIAEALIQTRRLNPCGIDISSGVETDGDKDIKKITLIKEIIKKCL